MKLASLLFGERVKRPRVRKHADGSVSTKCELAEQSYTCPGCKRVCCLCFGGGPDPRCDDCVCDAEKTTPTERTDPP